MDRKKLLKSAGLLSGTNLKNVARMATAPIIGNFVLDQIESGKSMIFVSPCSHKNTIVNETWSWCRDCGSMKLKKEDKWIFPVERGGSS